MRQHIWRALDVEFARFPALVGKPMSSAEVEAASRSIGQPFPADYREFLMRYGGAVVGAYPIFGLRPVEAMGSPWSVVEVNREFRAQNWPGVEEWVVISRDHAGNPLGLAGNGAVFVSDHDFGGITAVSPTFEEFIAEECLKLSSRDEEPGT